MNAVRSVRSAVLTRLAPGALALALLGAVVLASPAPAGAQGAYRDARELPEGVAGERIEQLIATVNSGDPERVRAFVAEAFDPTAWEGVPIEAHLGVFAQTHRGSGGRLEIYGVRLYDAGNEPNEHTVILRNPLTEGWQAVVVTLTAEPPHRIAGIQFAGARPPHEAASEAPAIPDDAALAREIARYVDRLAAADLFAGTVLVARGDQILYEGAWGEASRRYAVANRIDTKFNLGSMNKMFTSVAIAKLVEQGKVAYADPLSKYAGPDWLPREITDTIRVEHLLTHTSGLGSYFNDTFFDASRTRFRAVDDYKPLVAGETLAFEPGTDWRYSNTGMLLLGVVIEKASGKSYFDFVREAVYAPAGMTGSDSYDMDHPVPNLAMGYTHRDGEWIENTFLHVIRGGPAGGGFSTAPDLFRFSRALTAGKLVPPDQVALLTSPKPELGSPEYGYGFAVGTGPLGTVFGHGGGFPGISANLEIFPDTGYTIIVLTNVDGGATTVQPKIRELVAAREAGG